MTDVYQHLYEERYQFEQRHPVEAVIPRPNPNAAPRLVRATFGQLLDEGSLAFIHDAYKYVFDPSVVTIDESNFYRLLSSRTLYPLRTSRFNISVTRVGRSYTSSPTVFLLSGTSSRDIIDYWNIRALGRVVLPLPVKWIAGASDQLETIISSASEISSGDGAKPYSVDVIRGRSLADPDVAVDRLRSQLDLDDDTQFVSVNYPRLWNRRIRRTQENRRCIVEFQSTRTDHDLKAGNRIIFDSPSPEFSVSKEPYIGARWVNVVRPTNYSDLLDIASVFPPQITPSRRLVSRLRGGAVWFSREGISYSTRQPPGPERWLLPNGYEVFRALFKEEGFKTSLSPAGKLAREATDRLGGLRMAGVFRNEDLLSLLDEMAAGQHVVELEDESEVDDLPRARGRVAYRQEVLGLLKRTHEKDIQAEYVLTQLTDSRILQVGLIVDCTHCDHSNWVSLDQIAESIECERCLEEFQFPVAAPPNRQWAYRTAGPFAVENYMQGSYSVLLAALVLSQLGVSSDTTWTSSFRANKKGLREHEVDFGILAQDAVFAGGEITKVFGEGKSYKEITTKDIETAKVIRRYFPDSLFCFAYLKDNLGKQEKKRLREFVTSGWKRAQRRQEQAIVLTGRELLTKERIPKCWDEKDFSEGGKPRHPLDGFRELARATQNLYLNLGVEEYRKHLA